MNTEYPVKKRALSLSVGIFLILLQVLTHCAFYSFKGTIPTHLKNMRLEPFENRTAEFNIELEVDEELNTRLQQTRLLTLTTSPEADSHIEGVIKSISDIPSTYDKSENVTEYRLQISGQVIWQDDTMNKPLFSKNINEYGTYFSEIENSQLSTDAQRNRDDAKVEAIRKIVDRIIESMTEGW
ncbi:MAG TPA: hypothetical protein DHU63_00885 [Candidatus Marinimicrobia bacterium]|nr:MAG: hypothetical protein AUJ47_02155 [Candidatus Marinimicrobia bacterium CG1_02_48_14]PIZ69949.1 MAG: hypothetical protein COY19_00975 [Candidatus Marinimicrobia bacterium CG_4_10_14_0_2_um_filter_48_9]HCW75073.1 hypothetical protein [Candidatus Neomarinimicrobiota bacterium]